MSVPTGTFTTASAVGIREDLHDKIWMLNKDEFPFQSAIGSGTAKNTYAEWQTDTLGSASSTNYNTEGDDTDTFSITPTVRVGNRCQILKKAFAVSRTEESVVKAGRKSEIGMQTMKQGRQIRMDLETSLLLNQASSGSEPRKMGGLLSWLTSNVSRGSGGTSGGFSAGNTSAAGNGTQRTFTETLLQAGIRSAWNNGARPSVLMMNGFLKEVFSGFDGVATQYQQAQGKIATIIGAADRYVSNFGTFTAVADRYISTRDVVGIDPSYAKVLWLDKFKRVELAMTGDSRKYHIVGEVSLEVSNEAAHFVVADLTDS
jgi:hypothetical protein